MFVVKVSQDKSLAMTKSNVNYLNENQAEELLMLFEPQISEYDITDCLTTLHVLNVDETAGDIVEINFSEEMYKDYYQCSYLIPDEWTSAVGNITLWFEFVYPSTSAIIKTNTVSLPILTHIEEDDLDDLPNVSNEQLLLLETITGTKEIFTFNSDDSVQKIEHKTDSNEIVRTDIFQYDVNTITETRTLANGDDLTIILYTDDFLIEMN